MIESIYSDLLEQTISLFNRTEQTFLCVCMHVFVCMSVCVQVLCVCVQVLCVCVCVCVCVHNSFPRLVVRVYMYKCVFVQV